MESNWLDVNNDLPESPVGGDVYGKFIVWMTHPKYPTMFGWVSAIRFEYGTQKWQILEDTLSATYFPNSYVTHWMPLPASPFSFSK